MRPLRLSQLVLSALALPLLLACGDKLTSANLEKVEAGMSPTQVQEILGKPTSTAAKTVPVLGEMTTYTYQSEKGTVTLVFHNGALKTKNGTLTN